MRVLVLGGSHFVGRAVVEEALRLGHEVDVLNRGQTGEHVSGATLLRADRTDHARLTAVLQGRRWDAAIDTWAGAPVHASAAASILASFVGHYGYVSSRSVYTAPIQCGADEHHEVAEGSAADVTVEDYGRAKRGSELGILAAIPNALIARAGLIIGPGEDVGRLPWWLARLSLGGEVLCPGPPTRPLQYIDARDLALWMLRCAEHRVGGVFNSVSPVGHATMKSLLDAVIEATGTHPTLTWLTPEQIEAAGVAPWSELPLWLPLDHPYAGLLDADTTAAAHAGLVCRPVQETVRDAWQWMATNPTVHEHPYAALGLDPAREQQILANLRRS